MNTNLSLWLRVRAERHGLRLSFHQDADGLWVAHHRTGTRRQLWTGTLAEMWHIANGYGVGR